MVVDDYDDDDDEALESLPVSTRGSAVSLACCCHDGMDGIDTLQMKPIVCNAHAMSYL
jgi:hypothetical protein